MSVVAAQSTLEDVEPQALEHQEHLSNLRRLRAVLTIGLLMWLAAGVPGDLLVASTFAGVDSGDLLRVRLWAAGALALGLFAVRNEPSPAALKIVEMLTFTFAAAAMGMFVILDVGLPSPTTAQLSCILFAQGAAFPRPWRKGAWALGATWSSFVVVVLAGTLWSGRLTAQLADPALLRLFLANAWVGLCSLVILVVGGHAAWGLRRRAFAARQIGRYQLKRKIGAGGMGEVWIAWHAGLKRNVALKVLRAQRLSRARDRFLFEIEATARLTHPNTVRVLDRGVADGEHWYYAMELVEGRTLGVIVETEGPMPAARGVHIVSQVSRALAEAHGLGIVHEDLKPDNVMVATVGREHDFAKVCDFGMAQVAGVCSSGGTARWSAPEQLWGGAVDARADVYALGALLFFSLTGRGPRDPPPDDGSAARIPHDIQALVGRCMAPDRAARFADAGEVARALAACSVAGQWGL